MSVSGRLTLAFGKLRAPAARGHCQRGVQLAAGYVRHAASTPPPSDQQPPKASPEESADAKTAVQEEIEADKVGKSSIALGAVAVVALGGGAAYLWRAWPDAQKAAVLEQVGLGGFAPIADKQQTTEKAEEMRSSAGAGEEVVPTPTPTQIAVAEDQVATLAAAEGAPPIVSEAEPAATSASEEETASAEEQEEAAAQAELERKRVEAAEAAAAAIQSGLKSSAEASAAALSAEQGKAAAAAKRRQDARDAVSAAIASREVARIEAALQQAREACLGPCAEVKWACSIVEPMAMMRKLKESEASSSGSGPGLTPKEAENREREACESLDRAALEVRVLELTETLASARLHARAKLEESIARHLEAAELLNFDNLREALSHMRTVADSEVEAECKKLEESMAERNAEAMVQAALEVEAEVQALLSEDLAKIRAVGQEARLAQLQTHVPQALGLAEGLRDIEETMRHNSTFVEQAAKRSSLATAVLRLEDAILSGQGVRAEFEKLKAVAAQADEFVHGMLLDLPEKALEAGSQGVMPQQQLFKDAFRGQRDELVAATFRPPGGSLLAEVVGRLFAKLYIMSDSAAPLHSSGSASKDEMAQTLAALSKLDPSLDEKQLKALPDGPSRQRIETWVAESRAVVELWQTLSLIKARLQCSQMQA